MPTTTAQDREEIRDKCFTWAWLLDRREWGDLVGIFTEEVDLDYTSLHGGDPVRLPREQLVTGFATALGGLDATQHLTGNHLVTTDGDTAWCTASVLATHVLATDQGDPTWTVGGHYRYRLARTTDQGWLIDGLTFTLSWTSGNPDLMRLAVRHLPDDVRTW